MGILIPYLHTDHTALLTAAPKQLLRPVHPVISQIPDQCLSCLLTEDHTQMIRGKIHMGRQKIQ